MDTNTVNPQETTTHDHDHDHGPARLQLRRSCQDRMLGGVAAGIAHYFGIDVVLVRIAFAVLTVVGGGGIVLYLACLLLIPDECSDRSIAGSILESLQTC